MFDVIIALGAIAAIICALPALGLDVRIFGRGTGVTGTIPGTPQRRWWVVMVVACLSLLGAGYNSYRSFPFHPDQWHSAKQGKLTASFLIGAISRT